MFPEMFPFRNNFTVLKLAEQIVTQINLLTLRMIFPETIVEFLLFSSTTSFNSDQLCFSPWQTFVYEEDMYYQASPYSNPVRLTTSGEQPGVRNGVPYWNDRGMTGIQERIQKLEGAVSSLEVFPKLRPNKFVKLVKVVKNLNH